jgi:hypothetical protein
MALSIVSPLVLVWQQNKVMVPEATDNDARQITKPCFSARRVRNRRRTFVSVIELVEMTIAELPYNRVASFGHSI